MNDRDVRVREEAYRLWVAAGRPEGDEQRHWFEAEQSVSASDKAGETAPARLNAPGAVKGPKPSTAKAAGSVAADLGSVEAKGRSAKEAEAFAKRRPGKSDRDVEGAAAAPAAGPTGAASKLAKAGDPASGKAKPAKTKT